MFFFLLLGWHREVQSSEKTLESTKLDSYSILICISCITFLSQNCDFVMYAFVVNDHLASCLSVPEIQSQFRQMEIFLLNIQLPLAEKGPSFLNVLEVDDPKLCVLLHLMTPMEPIEPVLESPLARPLTQQKTAASDLLTEVGSAKTAMEGMLLSNMEKNAQFPFISYYVINKSQTDPVDFFRNLQAASLRKFDPRNLRYTAAHTLDLFNEVATIARPPLDPSSKRPHSTTTGYIISIYKVFEGDDGEKFEKNWLYWTGARMLYRYLPKSAGLRRITLHKSISSGDKIYLLLCECSNFLENLSAAALLLPALRARLCGYTGLYRTTASF
ncbi:uncharacterized protein LOC111862102 isoform X4 [Cryptotermes secundus]|uniref:uncharacterized protein LOC111862102 isoform X4 n=1 Tax=Cryptotermes secundus TaxID=105785 RepID=UPI000CD7BB6E|nr:uncharacterized protein LOC111862102 isoform X4 [Cryptotermes secundus]